jgi:hypothetical protein
MNDPSERARLQQEHEQRQNKLKEAKSLWLESERVLQVLRTQKAVPLVEATDDEILLWHQKLKLKR